MKSTNFIGCKFMQVEFALGSKKFFLLEAGMNSSLRIIDFAQFLSLKTDIDQVVKSEDIKPLHQFNISWNSEKRLSEKAVWYVDNSSIFAGTLNG